MLSRDLLADAVEAVSLARAPISPSFLQRRIRVGSVTASQLLDALEAAEVLGQYQSLVSAGRRVLVTDTALAHLMVAAAIEDGRIELHVAVGARPVPPVHPFEAARVVVGFDTVPTGACGYTFTSGDVGGFCTRPQDDPIHQVPEGVYVDDFRAPATVGRIRGRWSHLTADTPEQLHAFAESIGMRREWFQGRCKNKTCPAIDGVCAHFHYDVVDSRRQRAIRAGAKPIPLREFGAMVSARRAHFRAGADGG